MGHIDTTVIRLLDGTRACLHAVIENFSRRILAWRVSNRPGPTWLPGVDGAAGFRARSIHAYEGSQNARVAHWLAWRRYADRPPID